ncbi:MAG: DUF5343 domain-containing protein [Thermomicrobiales bacterium]
MAEYAYLGSPKKIDAFLTKIQEVGVPSKATQTWLTSVGFTSTNDRPLLSVMRQIGFIDEAGKPTALWEEFRGGDRRVLASGIRQGYQELYKVYPDAQKRSSAELESIVKSSAPKLGKDAITRVLSTFRTLVENATFEADGGGAGSEGKVVSANEHLSETRNGVRQAAVVHGLGAGVTININVQLTLPETTDAAVYEKLFSAMREHLLDGLANGA